MSINEKITKDSIEIYIEELAKEYKKKNNNDKIATIIIVGGAAILLKYNFRKTTQDIDASIYSSKEMLDAIDKVSVDYNLPYKWINTDFENSPSYNDKLKDVSKYYQTYHNKIEVRIIEGEYLIATKLKAGRSYKHDLSDIAGILWEHKKNGDEINKEKIIRAVEYLYDSWDNIPDNSKELFKRIFEDNNYEQLYYEGINKEEKTRKDINEFNLKYPDVLTPGNFKDIMENIEKKKNNLKYGDA
jgi:predicted nucleotidyltransferase